MLAGWQDESDTDLPLLFLLWFAVPSVPGVHRHMSA